MNDKKKIVRLSKNKKNELILEINPQMISLRTVLKLSIKFFLNIIVIIFLPLFSFFDYLATKKQLVLASVGLGIGLGLSVLISQRPDALFAFPPTVSQDTFIPVSRIRIPALDLSAPVNIGNVQELFHTFSTAEIIHDERSSGLGGNGVTVLTESGFSKTFEEIESVGIGDEIILVGENTAKYRFRVVEIRNIDAEYLPNVIGLYDSGLIVYKATDIFRTQLFILIAQQI